MGGSGGGEVVRPAARIADPRGFAWRLRRVSLDRYFVRAAMLPTLLSIREPLCLRAIVVVGAVPEHDAALRARDVVRQCFNALVTDEKNLPLFANIQKHDEFLAGLQA